MNKKMIVKLGIGVGISSVLLTSILLFILISKEYKALSKRYNSLFLEYSLMEKDVEHTINKINDKLETIEDSIASFENEKESSEIATSNILDEIELYLNDINRKISNADQLIYNLLEN